jgi:hypothetical protein
MVIAFGGTGGLALAQQQDTTGNTGNQPPPASDTLGNPPSKMEAPPPEKPMGQGTSLSLSDAPPEVQKTLKKEAQGNQIQDLKQTKDLQGNTIFQAEIVKGSQGVQIQVAPDGTLVKKGTPHTEK